MPRLIDVPDIQACPASLTISRGDIAEFCATGCRILNGSSVECVGIFMTAVVGDDGNVYSPMGPPNKVVMLARRPGPTTFDIVTGDPFRSVQTTRVTFNVLP